MIILGQEVFNLEAYHTLIIDFDLCLTSSIDRFIWWLQIDAEVLFFSLLVFDLRVAGLSHEFLLLLIVYSRG